MKKILALLLFLLSVAPTPLGAQDSLKEHNIKSLGGLKEVSLVFTQDSNNRKIIEISELGDYVSVLLRQKIPSLKVKAGTDASAWLKVYYITSDQGLTVLLTIHQWATLSRSKETIFVQTWDGFRGVFGQMEDDKSKRMLKERIDELLTSFAADYYRANP